MTPQEMENAIIALKHKVDELEQALAYHTGITTGQNTINSPHPATGASVSTYGEDSFFDTEGIQLGPDVLLNKDGITIGSDISIKSDGVHLGNDVSFELDGITIGDDVVIDSTGLHIGEDISIEPDGLKIGSTSEIELTDLGSRWSNTGLELVSNMLMNNAIQFKFDDGINPPSNNGFIAASSGGMMISPDGFSTLGYNASSILMNQDRVELGKNGTGFNVIGPAAFNVEEENFAFTTGGSRDYAGGQGVIFIAERLQSPTGNPTGGGVLYVSGGELYYRGPTGPATRLS